MEVVWVYENIHGQRKFYSRFNLLMLIASVSLWRKYHPDHKTVIYVDDLTNEVLEELKVRELWDSVRPLNYKENINRRKFWSGCKTKIISETKIPILLVDHDFLIFRNIDEYIGKDILCTYDEIASNWYPGPNDVWGKKLTTRIEHLVNRASNVSLFYLPDPEFANKYGKQTLINHAEFTAMAEEEMTANHMIYSEQFMLRQWIERDNIPYKTLCKNIWDCKSIKYTSEVWDDGYWDLKEAFRYYRHYGMDKRAVLDNRPGYTYDGEIEYLYRCINAGKRINIQMLRQQLINIENR